MSVFLSKLKCPAYTVLTLFKAQAPHCSLHPPSHLFPNREYELCLCKAPTVKTGEGFRGKTISMGKIPI